MSNLIDKLNKINLAAGQPMGFRTARAGGEEPKILLVAGVTLGKTGQPADYLEGADAVLLHSAGSRLSAKAVGPAINSLGDLPGGILLENIGAVNTASLMKTGCDFVVFTTASPIKGIPQDDTIGKVLRVEPALEDSLIRVINSLPVDAVLTTELYKAGGALDWYHLMGIQRLGMLLNKPLLVTVPPDIDSSEIQAIRDTGVKGLLIDADPGRPDALKAISRAISQLPARPQRKSGQAEALLPPTGGIQETITPDEEEKEYE